VSAVKVYFVYGIFQLSIIDVSKCSLIQELCG